MPPPLQSVADDYPRLGFQNDAGGGHIKRRITVQACKACKNSLRETVGVFNEKMCTCTKQANPAHKMAYNHVEGMSWLAESRFKQCRNIRTGRACDDYEANTLQKVKDFFNEL